MKVLIVAPTFGDYGGIEAVALSLADWLQRSTSHEVRVAFKLVGRSRPTDRFRQRCQELSLKTVFAAPRSLRLFRAILWADIVHGNNPSPDVVLMAKFLARPVVLTIHNYRRNKRSFRNWLWLKCARLANHRTYNSAFVRQTWEPTPLANSEVVPTVSHLPDREVPIEQRRGFAFVARLIPNKGLEILVKAYSVASIDREQWPLRIVGDGPLRTWVEHFVARSGVKGISVLGYLPDVQKGEVIASSRWLVAPSHTREDMGLTPIEARSVGVPSIVSRDGGLPEAAGPAALLCFPADAGSLVQALQQAASMSPAQYLEHCELAKRSLQDYLRPMDHYLGIYERVLARP